MNITFWENKEKKIIKSDLFSEQAKMIAEEVFSEADSKKNKPTQLRKFYDEVLRFESILKALTPEKQNEEFKKILPYLKMLNSKVAYAEARDLVSKKFREFINKSLSQIETKEDFEAFSGLFEAFMGFYKYYDEKGEKPQVQQQVNRPQGQGFRR
ncbi:MAG: type III-A CRISPR-associated protein Csm2 [Thermodesulfovibrio sp.]|nr:type III-A CRISPR-associated protein Csm2 [Thermodesulfovibrio sp.]